MRSATSSGVLHHIGGIGRGQQVPRFWDSAGTEHVTGYQRPLLIQKRPRPDQGRGLGDNKESIASGRPPHRMRGSNPAVQRAASFMCAMGHFAERSLVVARRAAWRSQNSRSVPSPPPTAPTTPWVITTPSPTTPIRISGCCSRRQDGTRYSDDTERVGCHVTNRPDDDQSYDRQAANQAVGRRTQQSAN